MERITRKIDKLGRIVLPMDFRKSLGLESGEDVVLFVTNGTITIKKNDTFCKICNSESPISEQICICKSCIQKIKRSSFDF